MTINQPKFHHNKMKTAMSKSKSSSNSVMYVAMQLKRPTGMAWGLNLAFFDDRDNNNSTSSTSMNHQYLIIGDARTDVLKRVTSWCHVVQDGDARRQSTAGAAIATASNIDINRFFNHESYDDASAFISSFQSYWEQLEANTPASSYSADGPLKKQKQRQHNSDHQKCLLPGDWILSINGYPPARFGGTLEHVCQYLRQVNDFTIVVARSNIALANSMQVLSSSNAAVMNRDVISLESARAAARSGDQQRHDNLALRPGL